MSTRLHAAPRPRRDSGERVDLADHVTLLIALLVVLAHLPAVALVWVAAWFVVAVLGALLLGRILKLGRPVPDQEGRHRG